MKRIYIFFLFLLSGFIDHSVFAQELVIVDSLKQQLSRAQDSWEQVDIYNGLASEMMDINIHLAKNYIDTAIQLAHQNDYRAGLGKAFHNAGMERWLNGYYQEAENYYRLSIKHHIYLHDSVMLAKNYSYLGLSFHYHSAYDSALYYHNLSLQINEALGNKNSVAHNLDNIALAYHLLGVFDKVIENSSRALEIRSQLPGYSSRTNVYNYGGQVFNQMAFDESIQYYKDALNEEIKNGNNLYRIGQAYNNIGSTFYGVWMYDSAIYYLRKSTEIIKKINIPNRYAGQLNELGEALREQGYLDEAEKVFTECLAIWDSVGNQTSKTIIRNNLAQTFYRTGDLQKALITNRAAMQLSLQMRKNPFLTKIGYLESEILMKLGLNNEAIKKADSTLKIARNINSKNLILKGYTLLSRINEELGNYEDALNYSNKYSQLKDSLYNGESSLQLAQMQVVYETNQKNKAIEMLNTRNEAQESKLRHRNIIILLTVLVIFAISFWMYMRQGYIQTLDHQTKKIEHQNIALAKSNHEKDLLLGEIHHRVKNNLQIISSILDLQSRRLEDAGAVDALKKGQNRVKAMAMIHQQLYKKDEFASMNVHDYFLQLIRTISQSFGYEDSFELIDKIENIYLDLDSSVKLGLICNELITNVFKYAFDPSKTNILKIVLQEKEGTLLIRISDNGPGVETDLLMTSDSFGIFLVKNLVEDMDGELTIDNTDGTSVQLILSAFETVSRRPLEDLYT